MDIIKDEIESLSERIALLRLQLSNITDRKALLYEELKSLEDLERQLEDKIAGEETDLLKILQSEPPCATIEIIIERGSKICSNNGSQFYDYSCSVRPVLLFSTNIPIENGIVPSVNSEMEGAAEFGNLTPKQECIDEDVVESESTGQSKETSEDGSSRYLKTSSSSSKSNKLYMSTSSNCNSSVKAALLKVLEARKLSSTADGHAKKSSTTTDGPEKTISTNIPDKAPRIRTGGRHCIAANCFNYYDHEETRNAGVTFHTFPKKASLRSQWESKVRELGNRRPDWKAKKSSFLCSLHFTEDCIDRTKKYVIIKKDAIPTNFHDTKICRAKRKLGISLKEHLKNSLIQKAQGRAVDISSNVDEGCSNQDLILDNNETDTSRDVNTAESTSRANHDVTRSDTAQTCVSFNGVRYLDQTINVPDNKIPQSNEMTCDGRDDVQVDQPLELTCDDVKVEDLILLPPDTRINEIEKLGKDCKQGNELEHSYAVSFFPRVMKRNFRVPRMCCSKCSTMKSRLKTSQQKARRWKRKVLTFNGFGFKLVMV